MIELAIECLLIFLLIIAIGYCYVLDRRLKALRSGHSDLREVITDLVKTTHTAQEAIMGLRATADDVDERLSLKLNEARYLTRQLGGLTEGAPAMELHPGMRAAAPQPIATPAVPVAAPPSTPLPAGNNIFLRRAG